MDDILQQLRQDLDAAQDSKQLEQVRIKYLGRKGLITTLAKSTDFSRLSPEEKRSFGQRLNTLKSEAERLLA
ncbi:MAG: hypothetical protein WHT09_16645, partial [Thermogutta sp.]